MGNIRAQAPDTLRKSALLKPHFAHMPVKARFDRQHIDIRRQVSDCLHVIRHDQ
jgi:hypothetical protein